MNRAIDHIRPAGGVAACPACGAHDALRLCYWPRGHASGGKAEVGFACLRCGAPYVRPSTPGDEAAQG